MATAIQQMIENSTVTVEDQTVIIRVGDRWNRHEEVIPGATLTNIIIVRGEVIGRYIVDLEKYPYFTDPEVKEITLPFRKVGDNVWKLND